jgi:transcriptional regulator with XRE-family HTH domain
MREDRTWTQAKLAEKLGTTQNTVSRLENPKTSKPTITTLKRIAEAFDVALIVKFAPFSEFVDTISGMSCKSVAVPDYNAEVQETEKERERALAAAAAQAFDIRKPVGASPGYWPDDRRRIDSDFLIARVVDSLPPLPKTGVPIQSANVIRIDSNQGFNPRPSVKQKPPEAMTVRPEFWRGDMANG